MVMRSRLASVSVWSGWLCLFWHHPSGPPTAAPPTVGGPDGWWGDRDEEQQPAEDVVGLIVQRSSGGSPLELQGRASAGPADEGRSLAGPRRLSEGRPLVVRRRRWSSMEAPAWTRLAASMDSSAASESMLAKVG